jgi:hypothetical protein
MRRERLRILRCERPTKLDKGGAYHCKLMNLKSFAALNRTLSIHEHLQKEMPLRSMTHGARLHVLGLIADRDGRLGGDREPEHRATIL